ncbi:LysR family transcriptional regulator [Lactiplantibacillus fabifermentans]|uniref:Transcription regulator n=2 Tax=Lactiplantibacillus fabifermentans TaxID=483011 RepID=A0A0R2NWA2_9LACO|nr:LysR family transcriptional regulator [Lactiplantibacillus fabifermentans]ETY75029.1 LysR family transcriptional regulator [Lactiplantibacillus fabifermentans T30PCM01]KRO28731.1 transcription regulator [Lactiplantibacillus fabifermentans DSM 21115]
MLDNYLLEELVVFDKTGTLAATAQQLNVTQPTVTRGMQKLESDLGVTLFDRQPNRITLTKTGQEAAQQAAKLLAMNHQLVTDIRNFDAAQQTLTVATTIPGPLILFERLHDQLPANITVKTGLLKATQLNTTLKQHDATLIITNQAPSDDQLSATLIGTENLAVNLNKFMYQANQASITFAELKGLSFIVLSDIGPWRELIQAQIPAAKFFYQKQREALAEITQYSDFPYFSTNLSPLDVAFNAQIQDDDSRVRIPISDASAHMPVYATYLTSQRHQVQPLITQLIDAWPTVE